MCTLESNSKGIGRVTNGGFFIQMSIIINLEHNNLPYQGNHDDMQHHSWKLAGHPEKDVPCLRKQNHQMFLPMLVHESCFDVCASRAGLGHQQTKQLPLAFPFPPPSSLLQGHLRGVFLHLRPCYHLPISYCTIANCLLREEQMLPVCEGSRSSWCLGSRRLWKSRRQCQSFPMGMASSPTSLVLPGTGCRMPSTNAVVIPGTVALIFTFIFSFSPLFPLLWAGGGSHLWDKVEPLQQQEELSGTLFGWGFFGLLVP